MRNVIVGTAGHIDHGKTSLVKALTGMDADRLEEEKRRGITIDIGFAHLELMPGIRLGFVDVPGHERFVKNMLAGAGGIDLVLFVIAADESIKPQTREHFEICRLLGIRSGIVALTKSDIAGPDLVDLVRLEAEEFVAGSFLAGAPIVAVSSTTGVGLDELRAHLSQAAAQVALKNQAGYFRLPIDRAFSAKGFGTVVTGTLISGSIARDSEVHLYPTERMLRVRGLHVYGAAVDRAFAGQRTAVNLAGIEPSEITRGMVLSEPGIFRAVQRIDCSLELLTSAKPLKHRAPVHFHAGTAGIEAEVRLFQGKTAIQPGEKSFARIVLREPVLLLPGDRFIIRRFSPVMTIGGGIVIDEGILKYRKTDDVNARLQTLATPSARVAQLVGESKSGMSIRDLIARTGLAETEIRKAPVLPLGDLVVDPGWFQSQAATLLTQVREFHRQNPLLPGLPRQSAGLPALLDQLLKSTPALVADGEIVRLRTHKLLLKEDEEQARSTIETAFEKAGLTTPGVAEVLAKSGVEEKRARNLLQILIREKRLVRLTDDLVFHQTAIASLRTLLTPRKGSRFNVGAFKEWTGISRKYAIPLLEFLDREHVTRREGDERVVL